MKWLNTVTQVLLSLMAIVVLITVSQNIYPDMRDWVLSLFEPEDQRPSGMLATDEARKLAKQNLRKQILTFKELQPLTNSRGNLFMIGVGQSTLYNPEQTIVASVSRDSFLELKEPDDNLSSFKATEFRPHILTGDMNNILIFDASTDEVQEVFKDRVSVQRAQANWAEKPTHLILFAATDDSNGDGLLSSKDNSALFIYDISRRRIIRVKHDNLEPRRVSHVFQLDYVIVQFLEDRNRDGHFTSYASRELDEEPLRYMKVDLDTGALSDVVPDELRQRLQKRLQGEEP